MNKNNDMLPTRQTADKPVDRLVGLTKDFTAETCARALMQSAAEMSASIGVEISWEVINIEQDHDVKKTELMESLGRLAKAGGAMLVGGKVNLIKALDARDPMRLIRQFRRNSESK